MVRFTRHMPKTEVTVSLVTAPFPERLPPGPATVSRISDEWATPLFATLATVGFGMMAENESLDAKFNISFNAAVAATKGLPLPVGVAVLYALLLVNAEKGDEESPMHMDAVRTLANCRLF